MSFLILQVIFETSRLATVVNGVLRKTTKDMELNGMFKVKSLIVQQHFWGVSSD